MCMLVLESEGSKICASAIKTLAFYEKSQHLGLSVFSSAVPHGVEQA